MLKVRINHRYRLQLAGAYVSAIPQLSALQGIELPTVYRSRRQARRYRMDTISRTGAFIEAGVGPEDLQVVPYMTVSAAYHVRVRETLCQLVEPKRFIGTLLLLIGMLMGVGIFVARGMPSFGPVLGLAGLLFVLGGALAGIALRAWDLWSNTRNEQPYGANALFEALGF